MIDIAPNKDETGRRYGRLLVIGKIERDAASRVKRSSTKWECLCDCGKKTGVFGNKLRNGTIKNCLRCERVWHTMK